MPSLSNHVSLLNPAQLRTLLEAQYERYNRPEFIANDPIQIPHRFSRKQDVEIMLRFYYFLYD